MTTTERLEKIKAKCQANLALAEKRTPGNWTCVLSTVTEATVRDETAFIVATANQFAASFGDKRDDANAAYIAACASAAEAGWKTTVATIDTCLPITEENLPLVRSTIAAWPEESL